MNRRQKIIISVTGIFLVLLILLGLTYAYFLTQITGNTNPNSISVETANLKVKYEDGTNIILDENTKLIPSSTAIGTKTFDVVNEGDEADYVVVVDNISIKDATTGNDTTFKTNDFVYTLECTSSDGNDCSDVKTETTLPLKNNSILIGNRMKSGVTHTYTLTLWYLDSGENQSDDMNKTLEVRINIEDIKRLDNPYKDNTNSLAYNIINNSLNKTNGTKLVSYPPSKVAIETSLDNWEEGNEENVYLDDNQLTFYADTINALIECDFVTSDYGTLADCPAVKKYTGCTSDVEGKYVWNPIIWEPYYVDKCDNGKAVSGTAKFEKVLSTTQDDFGISYYYRGKIDDNYVNFAGMCWRIVRIDGNGNTKLILEDQDEPCSENMNGNWNIPASNGTTITVDGDKPYLRGNYGYELKNIDDDSDLEHIMNYLNPKADTDKAMVNAFKYFQTITLKNKISSKYNGKKLEDYLVSGNWCLGDKAYTQSGSYGSYEYTLLESYNYSGDMYYDSYTRLTSGNKNGYNPTLKCNGTVMDTFNDSTPMYVATLTADEVVYAGNYYLLNDYQVAGMLVFLTLSPSQYFKGYDDTMFYMSYHGALYSDFVYLDSISGEFFSFRPSVTLKSGLEILSGGVGTKTNPYVIK